MTTKDLIREFNAIAADRGLPPLTGWKASKEALQAKIDGLMNVAPTDPLDRPEGVEAGPYSVPADPLELQDDPEAFGDVEPDTASPSAAEETTDEPDEHRGSIGAMVRDLLVDPEGYGYPEIVAIVRGEFSQAKTSTRSVASVAAALRRSGVDFPTRRKPAKGLKTTTPAG